MPSPFLDTLAVQKLLPHRPPFLMVDQLISLTETTLNQIPGRTAKAKKNVTINEPFFQGHFPHYPVMPGVLILEALAQTGALCCSAMPNDPPIKQLFFAGVDKARFKHPVLPGDTLILEVTMQKTKANFYWGEGKALVEGRTTAEAQVLAHITFSPPAQNEGQSK